jgi:hypothetical protein
LVTPRVGPRAGPRGSVRTVKLPTVSDVIRVSNEQVEALVALPGSIALLNRSLANFAQTVTRLDQLVRRLDRLTEPLEAPLTALAPRLNALVPLLDEDLIGSLPAVLDSVQRNAVPALELIGQTQSQVASIASSVERLMTIMDDGFSRLQELPGAALVSRLRGGGGPKGAAGTAKVRTAKPAPVPDAPPPPEPAASKPSPARANPPEPPGPSVPVSPSVSTERPIRRSSKTEEQRGWRG